MDGANIDEVMVVQSLMCEHLFPLVALRLSQDNPQIIYNIFKIILDNLAVSDGYPRIILKSRTTDILLDSKLSRIICIVII
jgi:hypothetical protein